MKQLNPFSISIPTQAKEMTLKKRHWCDALENGKRARR